MRSWLLRRVSSNFQSDRNGESLPTLAAVIVSASPGNEFTATLVPEGSGVRVAFDRDGDGYFNSTETEMGYNPGDPLSHPGKILSVAKYVGQFALTWDSVPGLSYTVQWATNFTPGSTNSWSTLFSPLIANTNTTSYTDAPPALEWRRFYRIRTEP